MATAGQHLITASQQTAANLHTEPATQPAPPAAAATIAAVQLAGTKSAPTTDAAAQQATAAPDRITASLQTASEASESATVTRHPPALPPRG